MKILIQDGADLSVTIQWSPVDQILADKLKEQGHEVTLEHYEQDVLKGKLKEFDAIVVKSTQMDSDMLQAAAGGKLKAIIQASALATNIDTACAEKLGIAVMATPAASSNAVAELILGNIISISRFYFQCYESMRKGEWNSYVGIEITGRTLGLFGLDDTAKLLAKKASALGMKVRYWDEKGADASFTDAQYMDFEALLADSTYISVHAKYNPEKGPLLGEAELMRTEKGANIINCCDARLIDEAGLLKALGATMAEMHLFGVSLDVFQTEPCTNKALLAHDRLAPSPHMCEDTYESNTARIDEILAAVKSL